MFTESFAQSMQQGEQKPLLQQKLATASDTEQVTKAEGLDSMTGELEDQELETVAGGIQTITVSGPIPDSVTRLMRQRDGIANKYQDILQSWQGNS